MKVHDPATALTPKNFRDLIAAVGVLDQTQNVAIARLDRVNEDFEHYQAKLDDLLEAVEEGKFADAADLDKFESDTGEVIDVLREQITDQGNAIADLTKEQDAHAVRIAALESWQRNFREMDLWARLRWLLTGRI